MKRIVVAALLSIVLSSPALLAQSVTISPSGYVAIPLNTTTQFTATVTGLSNTGLSSNAVSWSVVGSPTMYGTITSSGLYTPPATFPANPAEIIATSLGTPVTKATQFVYFLSPGPPITLVSPNPIPVGTSTVTITGSGFQKGAVIDYTTPGAAPVQASAKFVSSTTLTASVYLALPTTATFYVINPGTAPSNSLSVTVGASNTVALNVINGSGSGNYAPGTVVTITANPAPTGEFFSSWTGATVASATSPSTTITVRSNSATVTANYSSSQTTTYPLTVVNGFGSGNYAAGTVVSIAAITAPSGQVFGSWTGAAVASASSAYTTITMPAAATTVTANYTAAQATYLLTVYNGSGSGNYAAGTSVTIASGPPPSGQVFGSWSGATVASATSATTTLTMPAAATTVTANFAAAPSTNFTLTVNSGSGGGSYPAGTVVTITANTAPSGQFFSYWTGAEVASATSATTTLTMPAAATTVTANYSSTARITIAPAGYVAIPANGTVQFSATVTGVSNASVAVTWSVAGNSATYGTITPAGLYTAPATIPANPAQITATGSGASASHYVYFLVPGPTLTQIAPNPIPSGTTTITLTGSGFQNGAEAVISNTGVQLSTAFVSANTLTASNYFASGTTATFYVVNPGSAPSNSITVPVSGPAAYALTVINGSGSGNYTAGTAVTISAGSPPAGQAFMNWTGASVANSTASTTTIIKPAVATTVTANFGTPPTTFALKVVNGAGSGNYPAGNIVSISANTPPGQTFQSWTGATVANPSASYTTLTMPSANATVTANFVGQTFTLTVVNGTGSGTYAVGASVPIAANPAPAGEYFQSWTGPGVANANQPSTTVTMPASNATVTAGFYTPTAVPFPVSAHPRLWVTPADVTRLQGWATSSNSVYQAYMGLVSQAIANYKAAFPSAALTDKNPVPASAYTDLGDVQGYQGMLSEENAMILAFQSLIDPNVTKRQQYAQAARNLIMYALNQAALGHLSGAPFRDPVFMVYNRASATGHEWPLVVDWIYNATDASGNPILTAPDKATIQQVFLMWSNDCVNASTTGGDSPQIHGVLNSLQLLPGNAPYRMASNNYYLAHARVMTMMGLALDPSDDPPVNPAVSPSVVGNTERSYILEANGAWLYQIWAMMGEPAAIAQGYSIPDNPTGAGFGLASGGLPPEGMLYGESFAYILGQLLALQTAGFHDPSLSGPQIQMIGSPVWDRYVTGFLSSLTPTAFVSPTESYLGPVYQFAGYGDLLRGFATPDFMRPFALLALLDQENGKTDHMNAARWFSVNAVQGGASQLASRISDPWTWGATSSLLYFMMLDPSAATATDPRPNYPTLFYDAPASRVVAHTDWSANGTMFDYRASWISINHQDGNGGMFELYRKGEWLTKEMSNYDAGGGGNGATTEWHNALSLQNWCLRGTPLYLNGVDVPEWTNGSQWMENEDAGDPTTVTSNGQVNGATYVYATSDLANLFNRPDIWSAQDAAIDVTQSTRSILWMNNVASSDFVVVYDRATTAHSGLFKRFNMSLVTNPVINGNTSTETMPDNQKLFVQTLLPSSPSITSFNGAALLSNVADLEPTQYILQVQDPSEPADTRFLHVLQGADPGAPLAAATYLQSTAGTPFDGAQFATVAAYFPVSSITPFAGTTLTAPAGVHTALVTGLTPVSGYSVTLTQNAGVTTIVITAGGPSTTDAAGVLVITF